MELLAAAGPVDDGANLEREQDAALHPDVCLPACRCFLRGTEFTAAETGAEFVDDRQGVFACCVSGEGQEPFDFVFEVHFR